MEAGSGFLAAESNNFLSEELTAAFGNLLESAARVLVTIPERASNPWTVIAGISEFYVILSGGDDHLADLDYYPKYNDGNYKK